MLYERLDGFPLSDLGHEMAQAAAEELAGMNREISKLYVSPLERTRQSAAPVAHEFGLEPTIEERIIEPWNRLRGYPLGPKALLAKPASHQLPIWMTYRSAQGLSLPHNPRNRRCSLSSITSFDVVGGKLVPVDYREPGLRHAGLI
ncbi:MAG: histidine phosphatase family protein [Actinobacteria bacterium]|nr:histidine phosphatase family protein [Actinomycetota bacterium]